MNQQVQPGECIPHAHNVLQQHPPKSAGKFSTEKEEEAFFCEYFCHVNLCIRAGENAN